jgi:UDPglucose 6-dehydrogenase
MNKISIIGYGIVGKSILIQFENRCDIQINDPLYDKSSSIEDISNSEFIFICVPTPTNIETCCIDDTILSQTLCKIKNTNAVVVIKSTITPDKLLSYKTLYPNMKLIMCPEFLTEKNYLHDAKYPKMIVIGGDKEHCEQLQKLYELHSNCVSTNYIITDLVSASLIKYMINCFLTLKVSFMNQIFDIYEKSESTISWDELVKAFSTDERIGKSHLNVPGPDGYRGWGGKCFYKDINAFIGYGKTLGLDLTLLKESIKYNELVREEKDWLKIDGAITKPQMNKYILRFKRIKTEYNIYIVKIFINDEKIPLSISWLEDKENEFLKGNKLDEICDVIMFHIKEYEEEKHIKTNITLEDVKQAYLNMEKSYE